MPDDRSLPPRDGFLIILVTIIWGANFVPIRWALDEIPPLALSGLRFLLAAVPLIFFVRPPTLPWRWTIAYGTLIGVLQFGLLFLAIKLGLAAGLASLLMQMQMFFTMGLAALVTGDKIRRRQVEGGCIALVGLGLLAWSLIQAGAKAGLLSLVLVLFSSFSWASGNVLAKAAGQRHKYDMFALVVWSSLVAPLPLAVLSFTLEGRLVPLHAILDASPRAWVSVLFMSYAASLAGYGLWNLMLRRHSAGVVSPFTMIIPVVGLLCGVFVLGETLDASQILGAITILAGIAVSFTGPRRGAITAIEGNAAAEPPTTRPAPE